MEVLSLSQEGAHDMISKVLSIMQSKGVKRDLLVGLSNDLGFHKFCTEWVSQKCSTESMQIKHQDTNTLNEMKEKLRVQKNLIGKLKVAYTEREETKHASDENNLELRLMLSKYEHNSGYLSTFDSKTNLTINTTFAREKRVLKAIKLHIPECYNVTFTFSKNDDKMVRKFFRQVFPNRIEMLQLFYLNGNSPYGQKINIGIYLKEIQLASLSLTRMLRLRGFSISQAQLKRLFSVFKRIKIIVLSRCLIDFSTVPDLSQALENCSLRNLDIDFSIINRSLEVGQRIQNCQNFIEALAQAPDLAQNLEKLKLTNVGFSKEVVKKICATYQLDCILDNKNPWA
ncbi:unnamed protein product [Moneuplotes crassus]|uniref:Uncharacterized protein n=1 Tax=Euplotes crassus TaxID=5936 RepID=A0AAD1XM23_EUPCR|nr:unnamed protein product [Moneuplotes crassus]